MSERDRSEPTDDYVAFAPALQDLWAYRRVMGFTLLGVLVSFLIAMVVMSARAPRERIGTLGFRLTFTGAERGEFPNGTKFSASEIVSAPVLSEVFTKNALDQYTISYPDFKNALFVVEADPDLQMLAYEYESKLSDPRLSPVDRARIEEEYRTKRESQRAARFALNIRGSGRLRGVPDEILSKIAQDTLSTWAQHAADRKGALRYDIPVISQSVLKSDLFATDEPLIAVDMLRGIVTRILTNLSAIATIPGAAAVRTKDAVSLEDIRISVEDLLRFRIDPLVSQVGAAGRAGPYFESRLASVQIERAEVQARLDVLQQTLQAYQQRGQGIAPPASPDSGRTSGVTPQLTESFIDRLVELATQPADIAYRQQLTDRIIREGLAVAELDKQRQYYESMRRTSGAGGQLGADVVGTRIEGVKKEIEKSIGQVQGIYAEVSQQTLNPDTVLYSVTSPFVAQRTSTRDLRSLLLYFGLAYLMAMAIVIAGCLAHAYYVQRIRPARRTAVS